MDRGEKMFFKTGKNKVSDHERRRNKRASFFQSSYFLQINTTGGSGTSECWFNNISEGGLAFETRHSILKEGDEIKVLYKLGAQLRNDSLRIQSATKVFDKYRYSCTFINSDENRKLMIEEYFKSQSGN